MTPTSLPDTIAALRELYLADPPEVSFEFFPPKTPEMEAQQWEAVRALEPLSPRFVSVTYGAGGSTRERTRAIVSRIREETSLVPAAHLTCVGATREEVDAVARQYWESGVRHIVALRGDMPGGEGAYVPHPDGYAYADALVAGLRQVADFEISVACYPETHPDALSPQADIEHLKRKFDAGATRAISQYFFDVDVYLRFADAVRAAGIDAPLVPGILPVTNYAQLVKFSKMCGAGVPAWITALFEGLADRPELHKQAAVAVTAEQCRLLRLAGVSAFHFYTLNRADLVRAVCHLLGIRGRETETSE